MMSLKKILPGNFNVDYLLLMCCIFFFVSASTKPAVATSMISTRKLKCHIYHQFNTRPQTNRLSSALSAGVIDTVSKESKIFKYPNTYILNRLNINSFERNDTLREFTHNVDEIHSPNGLLSSSYLISSLRTLPNASIEETMSSSFNNVQENSEATVDNRLGDNVASFYENSIKSISAISYNYVTNFASLLSKPVGDKATVVSASSSGELKKNVPVMTALQRMSRDIEFLDNVASRTPQLTKLEFAVLSTAVLASAISPSFLGNHVVEVLVPSMAALSASVGISAEYVGKVAVSNGKEVTALAIQAAAEAEVLSHFYSSI